MQSSEHTRAVRGICARRSMWRMHAGGRAGAGLQLHDGSIAHKGGSELTHDASMGAEVERTSCKLGQLTHTIHQSIHQLQPGPTNSLAARRDPFPRPEPALVRLAWCSLASLHCDTPAHPDCRITALPPACPLARAPTLPTCRQPSRPGPLAQRHPSFPHAFMSMLLLPTRAGRSAQVRKNANDKRTRWEPS